MPDKNWIRLKLPGGGYTAVRSNSQQPPGQGISTRDQSPRFSSPEKGRGTRQFKDLRSPGAKSQAKTDSGMLSNYQPATHIKSSAMQRMISNINSIFLNVFRHVDPELTSEQGSSATAAPSVYQFVLWQERYERRAIIQEVRQAFDDDPRIQRACRMFGREAVRGGIVIVLKSGNNSLSEESLSKAQAVAERVQKIVNPLLESWAVYTPIEGEQFTQAVVKGDVPNGELIRAKRMPTSSMERNTNDADEFPDPYRAFSQVDILTNGTVADFQLALMHHTRWNWIDGDRYGKSELISIRRLRRLVLLCEDAQARRRISRAPQRVHWKFGGVFGGEIITPEWDVINRFKEENGFVMGVREQFDPTEVGRDTFGTLVEPIVVKGDQTVHEIDDLRYLQNVMAVGLPTPGPIYNLDAEKVNRDVVGDLRAEWLKQTQTLSGKLEDIIRWLMDLGLLLQGILPEAVDYTVRFSESTVETPSEMVKRVVEARSASIGTGRNAIPSPLISLRTAITTIAEHFDLQDIPDEEQAILQEIQSALQSIGNEENNTIGSSPLLAGGGRASQKGKAGISSKSPQKGGGRKTATALQTSPSMSGAGPQIIVSRNSSKAIGGQNQGQNQNPLNSGSSIQAVAKSGKRFRAASPASKLGSSEAAARAASSRFSGKGQSAANFGSLYGQPEEQDFEFTGQLQNPRPKSGQDKPNPAYKPRRNKPSKKSGR